MDLRVIDPKPMTGPELYKQACEKACPKGCGKYPDSTLVGMGDGHTHHRLIGQPSELWPICAAPDEFEFISQLAAQLEEAKKDVRAFKAAIDAVNALETGRSFIGPLHGAGIADGLRWARETIQKTIDAARAGDAQAQERKV